MPQRKRFLAALLFAASLLAAGAEAALVGQSTSVTGALQYAGFGDSGGGVGSGRYTLGNCSYAGSTDTTACVLTGTYVETEESTHAPGQSGTFEMYMTYAGNVPSPVIAHSIAPGSDVLDLATPGGAHFTLNLGPSVGGTITGVYPAPQPADSLDFAAFFDPIGVVCSNSPQGCRAGVVGLTAGATIVGGVGSLTFVIPTQSPPSTARNYQGLWWNSPAGAESGWGLNLAHQGDTIFATWFTYDLAGKAWWLSMTANKTGDGIYNGTLYQTNGPPFHAVPFTPSQVTTTAVGSGTLTFASATSGTFGYTVNGVSQTKAITPQMFGPLPTCAWGTQPDLSQATNFQDLWWASPAGVESGWGINFTQQGTTIFATWFTYDALRNPLWYSVTAPLAGPNRFTGTLYRTTGPAFNATPFDPARVQATPVGSATFTFADGNSGTFAYQVNDGPNVATQTKPITRQVFQAPGTVCR